ncbi:MAG: aminotransferase, partial [Desulfohalobiaceae bacterium]
DWTRPKAGPIAFPRLRQGSVDAFCADLVARAGVLLLPGALYEQGSNAFRIGFGRLTMPEALAKLESFLQENH